MPLLVAMFEEIDVLIQIFLKFEFYKNSLSTLNLANCIIYYWNVSDKSSNFKQYRVLILEESFWFIIILSLLIRIPLK